MTDTTEFSAASNKTDNGLVTQTSRLLANFQRFTSQPSFQRSFPAVIAVIAVAIGLLVYAILQQPERTTLYASLPDSEKSKVVDALKNQGVDVTLDPTTGEVLVPVDDYHSSRISLAAQGLPASVPGGYQSLNELPLGSSRSVELMRLKQSQEIELARSIREIEDVLSARVHLALPEKSVFVRNHLVSSSVPNMSKQDVTVVDQNGALLSKSADDPDSILSDSQLEHRMRLESIYRSRIMSLVTPIVGPGNVSAQVNLDMDFTRNETTEEIVDPKGTATRSKQTTLDISTDLPARGIPGAVSNTPPTQAELSTSPTENTGDDRIRTRSSSDIENFEVSRTISTTQKPSNTIIKITAAVLLRENVAINPETGIEEGQPLAPEKIAEIEKLVSGAIGINAERGDTLTVSSSPFVSTLEGVAKEWHEIPLIKNLLKQLVTILILAIVALGVIRPLLNRIMIPIGPGAPGEVLVGMEDDVDVDTVEVQEGESLEDIKAKLKPKKQAISADMLDTANTYDDKVAVIRMIVSEEAGKVSNVFKEMISKDMGPS
jgi:flagellar M-ring protein FliF